MKQCFIAATIILAVCQFPTNAAARVLTSIDINEKEYFLAILTRDEHQEAISLFNDSLELRKQNTKIVECDFVIDLPVGTAQGNHSYGGFCRS